MEQWQRRVLVTLGTLVVIMAAAAVLLVIRNALGSSGLTGGPVASQDITSGSVTTSTTTAPGGSVTTLPEPTDTPTTAVSETSLPTLPPPPATFVEEPIRASDLRLQPEGLGPLPFGTDIRRSVSILTEALGAPDSDTGWLPADLDNLQCPGTRARVVTWGSLAAYFSDGPTDWGPDGQEHFFSFISSLPDGSSSPDGPSLRTSEGLQLGATLSRSSSIYGESSITLDHSVHGTIMEVDVPGPGYLLGVFSGPDSEDELIALSGGTGCQK